MELLLNNPMTTILVAVVCILIGKYVWVSKDDNAKKDKEFTEEIHKLQLGFVEKFGEQREQMRIIQRDIFKEADEKFFTKEMAEKQNQRISQLEEMLHEIIPRMEKLDTLYDVIIAKNEDK